MSKKIFTVTALALGLALSLTNGAVFAEEGVMPLNDSNDVMPINETDDVTPINENNTDQPNGEIAEPNDTECPENDPTCKENIDLETGTMPDNDPALDEDQAEEDDSEPELWPMYLSLGALGAVVLVFIILNLFGRKKK